VPAARAVIHKENQCVTGRLRECADSIAQSLIFLPKMQAVRLLWMERGFRRGIMKSLAIVAAAAIVIGMSGTAMARTKTTQIQLDGECDAITINVTDKVSVTGNEGDACSKLFGAGFVAKVRGADTMQIVAGAQTPMAPGAQFVFVAQYPLVTGGSWALYVTTDGQTMSLNNSGTYTVVGAAQVGPKSAALAIAGRH
jgi:hypothetical protein